MPQLRHRLLELLAYIPHIYKHNYTYACTQIDIIDSHTYTYISGLTDIFHRLELMPQFSHRLLEHLSLRRLFVSLHIYINTHTHTHIYVCMYIHIHMLYVYIHTHIHMCDMFHLLKLMPQLSHRFLEHFSLRRLEARPLLPQTHRHHELAHLLSQLGSPSLGLNTELHTQ